MRLLKRKVAQSSTENVSTEKLEVIYVEKETRKTGIDVIGDAPWGSHFCLFYQTREDLIDVLVPYFKAGLENNEFCIWVSSEPLSEEEAKEAMRKAVPNFDRYVERGQIEIVPHTEWYLKDGAFNLERVLNAWIDKLDQALAEGYDGIRVTGNTAWLEKRDWKTFAEYEKEVNAVIGKYRMIAICTYSLDKCGASEVIDVIRNHQFALIKRRGEWELIESSELKQMKEALKRSEMRLKNIFAASPDAITVSDLNGNIVECNQATLVMHGFSSKEELIGKNGFELIAKKDHQRAMENLKKTLEQGSIRNMEYTFLTKDGHEFPAELSASVIKDSSGKPTGFVAITKDITERKRAEKALRESEEKFRNIFESANDCMIYLDRSGRILEVNRKAVQVFGGSKKELLGKHFTRAGVFHPRDIPRLMTNFANILAGKESIVSICIKNKKGQERFLECSSYSIKADGKIVGMMVIARDVTERKIAEEKLRESEERFRNLFESAGDGLLTLDLRGRITGANKKIEEISGLSREEIIGKHLTQFARMGMISFKDIPFILKTLTARIKGQQPTKVYELKINNKKGQEKFLEFRGSLIKQGGKPVGVLEIIRDVTDRKKMEEKLRQYSEKLEDMVKERTKALAESEKRYFTLVELANDGIAISIPERIIFANKRLQEMTGYSEEELKQFSFDKLLAPESMRELTERRKAYAKGEPVPNLWELKIRSKQGHILTVETSFTPVSFEGQSANLIIVRDITERKKMQEQLLKSERLAAIGELATMVGHDLRNPLQSIENATYYLTNELSRLSSSFPIPQKVKDMLQIIDDSVNYADRIIRDLQDFSAMKEPTFKNTDINAIVKETLSQIEAPENVELITELEHLPEIKVDKDMMKRVFLNLAVNGIQAMKEKGGKLVVSTKKTKRFVEISFKDTGTGISKENMEKLFTPFFTTKAKGMGMGLAICKRFVDAHGGNIRVESEEGKGSTFTVKLHIQQ